MSGVWMCLSLKALFLSHQWVTAWSRCGEFALQPPFVLLWPWSLACWRPSASLRLPHGEASIPRCCGGLLRLSLFALLHGRAFCLGFKKIPGYVWLLRRILWELGFVRRCVRMFACVSPWASPVIPERAMRLTEISAKAQVFFHYTSPSDALLWTLPFSLSSLSSFNEHAFVMCEPARKTEKKHRWEWDLRGALTQNKSLTFPLAVFQSCFHILGKDGWAGNRV